MATYTYEDPGTRNRDKVRFYVGDTTIDARTSTMLLSDEEIDYLLTEFGTVAKASVEAARAIAAKYARLADQTTAKVSVKYSQRASQYEALADRLERTFAGFAPITYAGGTSSTEKERIEGLSGYISPFFNRAQIADDERDFD